MSQQTSTTTPTVSVSSNFPAKLHFMLNELQRDGLEYIASWQQHGRCFIVRNPKEFENNILPCYFQQSKFTSFQRQLSFYGFRRIVSGRDKGGYFHEHFLRGQEELANQIQRTKIKGTGPRKPNAMELPVPNFYQMPYLPDNTNEKISNYNSEKVSQKTLTETCAHTPQGSSSIMKTFEMNIPEEIASSFPSFPQRTEVDENKPLNNRNQEEQLHQLNLLKQIDQDLLLLSRTSNNVQNYLQARQTNNFYGMGSLSPSDISCGSSNLFPSQSFLGLLSNYPSFANTSSHPLLSYNTSATLPFSTMGAVVTPQLSSTISPCLISDALTKYFQQQMS